MKAFGEGAPLSYLVGEEDLNDVAEIFRLCASLQSRCGLPFGPDGYTLGSAGELIVAHVFDLELLPSASSSGVDAETKGGHGVPKGRTVQIKTTSKGPGKGLGWRDAVPQPDYLVLVRICPPHQIEVYFNGPYQLVWSKYLKDRPVASANNTRSVRINRIIELDREVPKGGRLPRVRKTPAFRGL